ncbi:MAG: serine/threonine protein kinase [Gemmataceae bacterium]|nr:serine/threonine protein kinase [Gemmataceae bacterium]
MSDPALAPAASDRDERLARLLDEVTQQQQRGERPDLDTLARQHPDLIDELLQLVNIAQLAVQIGSAASTAHTVDWPGSAPLAPLFPTLPRTFDGYELLDEIGRGAMGVVYKAWEPSLKRFVAIKMMLRGDGASSADVTRFRGEAQSAAGLSHPNIVPVYKVGESEGRLYFSMKYVEGQTLAALVANGPLPPREAARVMATIARAVDHAHQAGILHRDLKPSNILLAACGLALPAKPQAAEMTPMITDFGLAKQLPGEPGVSAPGGLTGTGAVVGTPSYMSPEQASGLTREVSPASDVYSLGAILYELLTGRPPFQAASAVDVLLLVRSEEPVSPRRLNPGIDPDLELVCLKCLEKRPEHRYESAGRLAADLEAYLQGEPVSARISSLTYFVSRLLRETHHAPVLENWGVLWMWHSLKLFLLCAVTNVMFWAGVEDHLAYLTLWSVGLVVWGSVFWAWRRRGGPVTFVERQMAHAWAAGVGASIGTFVVEVLLGRPVLELSPMLAVIAGMVFLFKAGTLSGWFYVAAGLSFLTAIPMALVPAVGPLLFGMVSALAFFVPGLKYYRQRRRTLRGPSA